MWYVNYKNLFSNNYLLYIQMRFAVFVVKVSYINYAELAKHKKTFVLRFCC